MKDNQAKYPQLRFKGCTDPWEQRKLNNYLDVSKEKNKNNYYSKDEVLSVSGKVGIVNQIAFKGRSFAGASVAPYRVVHNGDVVYTKSPLSRNPFGIIKTNKGKTGIVSTLYAVYKPISNLTNTEFVQSYFELDLRMNKYMKPLVNIGAKHDMKVSDANALLGEVVFPPFEEQSKITKFLGQLDNFITLHQRKLAKLKELKQGYLQKLFPKNGSKFPQLRFKGFTNPWEQRRLGERFAERVDRSGDGEMLSVTIANGVVLANSLDRKDNSSSDKSNYKVVKKDDIAYNSMRMWQAASGVSKYDGIVSPAYTVLVPANGESSTFFGYQFKQTEMKQIFQRNSQGLTSDTWNLKYPLLSRIKTSAPERTEQIKIGEFLTKLDNLIAVNQRKLEKLQELKKGYLQKMFC